MKPIRRTEWADLIFIIAIFLGAFMRFNPTLLSGFAINDGGMFAVMVDDLKASHYLLPAFTTYNHLSIPFAYPPLGFYLGRIASDLFGWSASQTLRWVPAFFASLSVPAFYLLALRLLKNKYYAALSTLFFALMPRALKDILDVPEGSQGPPEVRHRAHVAFSTAGDMMRQLEQVHNRRKAFIYVSNGYDLDPFSKTRAKNELERYGMLRDNVDNSNGDANNQQDPNDPALRGKGNQWAFADLVGELAELTRAAVRANTTIYTIDPRGLVGGPDLDEKIDMTEYLDYVRNTQDSLRVLADLTGGIAVINQNDFTKALKRIDQETSDYYVVGYYSTNPDPTKRRRQIEVKVTRPGANVWHRTSYTLKKPNEPR